MLSEKFLPHGYLRLYRGGRWHAALPGLVAGPHWRAGWVALAVLLAAALLLTPAYPKEGVTPWRPR